MESERGKLDDSNVEALLRKYRVLGPHQGFSPFAGLAADRNLAEGRRWSAVAIVVLAMAILMIVARFGSARVASAMLSTTSMTDNRLAEATGATTPSELVVVRFIAAAETCADCYSMDLGAQVRRMP